MHGPRKPKRLKASVKAAVSLHEQAALGAPVRSNALLMLSNATTPWLKKEAVHDLLLNYGQYGLVASDTPPYRPDGAWLPCVPEAAGGHVRLPSPPHTLTRVLFLRGNPVPVRQREVLPEGWPRVAEEAV